MKNYIGIDLGGTSLRVARVNTDLEIEKVIKLDSNISNGVDSLVDKICNTINDLKNANTCGVGLSVPGQVDVVKNIILAATNIPFVNYEMGKVINDKCNLKVVLNNDANVAGLAESVKGSGKDNETIYYVTWSTGIGGALIINDKIINGNTMYTGEIGNLIIHSNDTYKHSNMVSGALEGLTSGTALKRYAIENGYNDAKGLIDAYKNNDTNAISIVEYVCDNFARALCTIFHVIEVEKFVIGGGVTINSGDVLLPLVSKKINNYLMPVVYNKLKIDTAKLGDDAGIYGAAILAINELKNDTN